MSFKLERAGDIAGWMDWDDFHWLAEQASRHKAIVELGCYLGRSTRALADNTPGNVLSIDDFYGPRDFPLKNWERRTILERYKVNCADLLASGKLRYIQSDIRAVDAAEIRNSMHPDMVFIDADHQTKSVVRDLHWALEAMPQGLLCGHDGQHKSIQDALRQVIGDWTLNEAGCIWWKEL